MFLSVDISDFIESIFWSIMDVLIRYFRTIDSIIILHRQGFTITLLDFLFGVVVISIILGAFLHISKPDTFYNDR